MSWDLIITALSALIAGLAIGLLGSTLRSRATLSTAEARVAELVARLEERSSESGRLVSENSRLMTAESARAALQAELDAERRLTAEKVVLLDQAKTQLKDAFTALSADALKGNNESFLQLANTQMRQMHESSVLDLDSRQKAIGDLLLPIRDALEKVDGKLQKTEVERAGAYSSLVEQVKAMADDQKELSARTRGLVDALKSPTVRGRWGEIQLKRVCEMAGMIEHCDFVEQPTVTGEDGMLRPDLKVKLPGGKIIVVDAKAPLQAYLESIEATDDATREQKLRDHARQVRAHMTALAARNYWSQFEETPEFIVMFLPGETFFSAALAADPTLIEYGVEQHVIPASPTTLIALLRSVAYGWQQDRIATNAQEISSAGKILYERLRAFADHFDDLRTSLDRAVDSYNRSVGSLDRRVLPAARRFRELGATSATEIEAVEDISTGLRRLDAPEVRPVTAENAVLPTPSGALQIGKGSGSNAD